MIKNLLFDLGGVIMDIRRTACIDAFHELGMANADDFLGEYCQAGPFGALEDGSMTAEQFRDEIRRLADRQFTDDQIDTAFGKFLIGIPPYRLEQLRVLHDKYHLYMLSNTNPIMWHDGIAMAFAQEGHDARFYFDGIVKSYEEGVMKPDPLIFRHVIDRFSIDPIETIFFDDSERNLEAAARLGFRTILVNPEQEFYNLLATYPEGQ